MAGPVIPVRVDGDVGQVRREVRRFAYDVGLAEQAAAEATTAATELATNLLRHRTIDGEMVISRIVGERGIGLEIVARDRGPGIADVDRAVGDRYSTNGTSGCGLGAVRRMMDEFEIRSVCPGARGDPAAGNGTLITARKWVVSDCPPSRFAYSVNSRPCLGETANGDSCFVHEGRDGLLVAVADGLGHGPDAAHASQVAMDHVRANPGQLLDALMRELHEALKRTRGAAVTLLRVSAVDQRMVHIGVGNVEARVYPVGRSQLMARPGVLGMGALPRLRVNETAWPPGGTLAVYSDGLTPKWDLREMPAPWSENVLGIGHYLMRGFAKDNDDATVVVVRELV